MLAVKHLDPVLGVDIHFIITPPGAVVPIPHPHIGIVFDPFDYLPLIGATVKVNGLPRAQAGTGGRTLPPHFPIGGVFAKPPGNENETFMGSSTVVVEDEPFTYMLLPVLSCQDIGMPSPPRKKGPGAKTLLLPLSIALSIPAGPPVFVGGPPTISLMGLGMNLAMGGLLKGLKKLRGLQRGSLRMRKLSDRIHRKAAGVMDKLGLSQRARDRVHKAICTLTGHPVDVVTGRVVTEATDWELPGPIPLRFTRHYSSSLGWRDTAMGYGWSHSLDLAVWEEDGRVVYRAEDGRELEFDTTGFPRKRMPVGAELYSPTDRLTLLRVGELRWEVKSAEGLAHRLRAVSSHHQGVCRVTCTYNRAGFETTYEYNEKGLLTWVVDSARRRLRFEHDGKGHLVSVSLPHPTQPGLVSHNRYTYSEAGDLVAAYDPLGHATHYDYAAHLLRQETDRTGLNFHFEYDGEGPTAWCIRTWGDGHIYHHRLSYAKDQGVTSVTNSLGNTTVYHWDGRGVVVAESDPLGNEWRREFDHNLRVTAETNPLGHTQQYEYDAHGNRTKVTTPDGATTTFGYDQSGQLVHARDALGGMWWWHYDDIGRIIEECNPLGEKERYSYDRRGNLGLVTTRDGRSIELTYDDDANLASLRKPDGAVISFKNDRLGRCVELVDADGNTGRCQHDLAGRLLHVEGPDGWFWMFHHNEEGLLIEFQTPIERLTYGYTGFHQLAREEWDGRTIQRLYDTEDRLVEVRNELGESYQILYDASGRIRSETDFSGRQWQCERDAAGRVTRMTTPGGGARELEHDALGRLTRIRYEDGTWSSYAYDLNGELIKAINQNSSLSLERDGVGRVVREAHGDTWVSLRSSAGGRHTDIESSLGARLEFKRNAIGGLQEIHAAQGKARWSTQLNQGRSGLNVGRSLPANIHVSRTYDQRGRLLSQNTYRAEQKLHSRTYDWQGAHRLRTLKDSFEGRLQFEHGPQGRLSSVKSEDGVARHRNPDPAGNIYREAGRSRRYSVGGLLLQDENITFDYDAEGRLHEKLLPDGRRWRYLYNAEGHLVEVERPSGERVRFTYDALGRRLSKEVGNLRQDYLWMGDVLLHEYKPGSHPVTWVFDSEIFTPLARLDGKNAHGIVSDHLGAPLLAFDETGAIKWQGSIAMDGTAKVHDSVLDVPWRWPGQYQDVEVDLVYNRFRYYAPWADRYLTPDPLGLAGGLSTYGYVSDPLVFVDPLGLIAGIYDFLDTKSGLPYVGKSVDIDKRIAQHGARVGSQPNKIQINSHGAVGRDRDYLLRLAEQRHMNNMASQHGPLANIRRAVALKNMRSYAHLENWYINGQIGNKPKCP